MATITSTIKLNDQMSSALRSILTQLEATENQIEDVREGIEKVPKSMSMWTVAMGGALGGLITKVGGFLTSAISAGINFNRSMEDYTTNFTTMLGGSVDLAKAKVEELQAFASSTPFAMEELAQGTQTLLAFGIESEYTTEVLRMLGDVALGDKQKFQSLSLVFGQVMSQGKLMGGDLLQMINAGFNPLQVISEKTGQSMSELKDQMSKGAISAAMVAEAFKIATSEGGQFYQGMASASQTFSGIWSTLQDNATALLGSFFAPIADGLKWLMQVAITVIGYIQPMVEGFVSFLIDHAEAIKVVLLVVGAVAMGFAVKWAIAWAIANTQTLITAGLIIAGVTAVILVITGIIKVLDYFGITTDSVLGFVGGIFGVTFAFVNNVLVGAVEVILGFVNAGFNAFARFANFVGNVFVAPVTSVIRLFENLANSVLGVLKGIASALDALFGSNLAGVVSGWQDNITNKANQLISKYAPDEQYKELIKPLDLKASDFGLERKEYGQSWRQGVEYGQGIGDKIGGFLTGVTNMPDIAGVGAGAGGIGDASKIDEMINKMGGSNLDNIGKGIGDVGKGIGGIGKGIKGVNDKLSGKGSLKSVGETKITDENLKYLKDISTLKYQKDYQKSAPQININMSTGDINNGMDANRLFNQFENIIVEAINNNLTA